MRINNKKNHLSRISISFIILLFAMCLGMSVFLGSTYSPYELLEKTTEIETWSISESVVSNGNSDKTTDSNTSFLNKTNSYSETISKNISSIFAIAAIPTGISLLLFLAKVFLFFLLTLFILLPDRWTLINKKVRLDN